MNKAEFTAIREWLGHRLHADGIPGRGLRQRGPYASAWCPQSWRLTEPRLCLLTEARGAPTAGPATRRLSGRGPRPGAGRPTHTRPGCPVVAAVPSLHRVGTSLPRSRESQSQPPGSGLQSDRRALLKRPSHRATRALTLRSARQATFGQTMRKACHMCSGCGFRPKPSARRGPKPLEAAAAPARLIRATPRPPAPGCGSPAPREGISRLRLCSIFTFHLLFPGISKMRRLCGERRPALFARPWRPAALCPHTM